MEIELDSDKAQATAQNFLDYVDAQFFDQTIVHRVVKDFVIQGGGLDENMEELPTRDPFTMSRQTA